MAQAGRQKGKKFYAVAHGYERGIYSTWEQCSRQVTGCPNAKYQGFALLEEARSYLQAHPTTASLALARPSLLSSTSSTGSDVSRSSGTTAFTSATTTSADEKSNPTIKRANTVAVGRPPRRRPRDLEHVNTNVVSSDTEPLAAVIRAEGADAPSSSLGPHRPVVGVSWAAETVSMSLDTVTANVVAQDVYVDGACRGNGKGAEARAGYGGFYGDGDRRNFSHPLSPLEAQTNNRAELRAVIHALRQGLAEACVLAAEQIPTTALTSPQGTWATTPSSSLSLPPCSLVSTAPHGHAIRRLLVHTDSKYVIDGLTKYSRKWMRNGFKLSGGGHPVLNQDLWKELIALRNLYNTTYSQQHDAQPTRYLCENTRNSASEGVEVRHVKGHSNIYGNEEADRLAVEGALKAAALHT